MERGNIALPELDEKTESKSENPYCLLLLNDEVNSFDYVINVLVEVCKHDIIQAEQCAYIAHFKGECEVKVGGLSQLEPLKKQMTVKGLTTEIEKL